MLHFDAKTAYLLAGFLYVIMPSMAWLVLGPGRSRPASLWCAGGVVLGVGTLLMALRRDWPAWLVFTLTNALFYAGSLMHIAALRLELKQKQIWRGCLAVFVVLLTGQEFVRVVLDSPVLRFIWILSGLAVLLGWTGRLAWQIHQAEVSFSAKWLAWSHSFMAGVLGLRAVRVFLGLTANDPLVPSWDSALTSMGMLVMSVFGSIAILGLYLERVSKQHLQEVIQQERSQASQIFGEKIAHLDRQRSMSEMAAALAHEISQPLTAVTIDHAALKIELANSQQAVSKLLGRMGTELDRAKKIMRGIHQFIQPSAPQFQPVDLLQVINDVMTLIPRSQMSSGVSMAITADKSPVFVYGDFIQLSQVVLNMLRNAIQAQKSELPLTIAVQVMSMGQRVRLTVEDDGPGFSEEVLARAGLAFTSTKSDGLGIGISISKKIIEQHGGTLIVRNRLDAQGGQVLIELPSVANATDSA
jgi:signal transduction histidine kinase